MRRDHDIGRRNIRRFNIDLRAGRGLQQARADARQQLALGPLMDALSEVGVFGRGQQIGEVRIVGIGIISVDRNIARRLGDRHLGHIDSHPGFVEQRLIQRDSRSADRGDRIVTVHRGGIERRAVGIGVGRGSDKDSLPDRRVAKARPRRAVCQCDRAEITDIAEIHGRRRRRSGQNGRGRGLNRGVRLDGNRRQGAGRAVASADRHRRHVQRRRGLHVFAGRQRQYVAVDCSDRVVGIIPARVENGTVAVRIVRRADKDALADSVAQ